MRTPSTVAVVLGLLAAASSARASHRTFTTVLVGSSEVPPNGSHASGEATATSTPTTP
jgi:hypothetical protein